MPTRPERLATITAFAAIKPLAEAGALALFIGAVLMWSALATGSA